MAANLTNISKIIMHGLRQTPDDRAAAKRDYESHIKALGKAERAKYDAMTPDERDAYDRLTEGMMPRLRPRR